MKNIRSRRHRVLYCHFVGLLVLALGLAAQVPADGTAPVSRGWEVERNVEEPSYARIEPTESNLNIDALVLTCALTRDATILQLELYLSTEGPLMPEGVDASQLRPDPRAMVVIDGRSHPTTMFFADDHVVVADSVTDRMPSLSRALVDAIQDGKNMVLRFDLAQKAPGQPSGFDGLARFDLQASEGGAAIAAVRRCVRSHTGPLSKMESHGASDAAGPADRERPPR
ncbi:hypothetical protein [Enhydrobacter sp.]|jgi:hypothetical protein|uniref:hypothetical protein n=1 Tax=Enhydrobacter sp. TaxID=1894999 RepID=UPI0026136CB5|nr:hypothetical protein [Enhydrobacter sp.]WIM11927.1 MAG: hypothetical protein OJF58_002886 [Enhydrobacter sp.]